MNNINITPRVVSAKATDTGRRSNNEDYCGCFEPSNPDELKKSGCIYIVADGVGGASGGEQASKYATEKVIYEYSQNPDLSPSVRIKEAITKANRDIFNYSEENDIRMATTMTVAIIKGNELIVANVGDSRVYLIRTGEVRQLTNDHNIVGELVKNGKLTESEALKSKAKNKLTRSIGGSDHVHVDVFDPIKLQANDKILLCTDGLTRYALKEDIAKIASVDNPDKIAANAIDFAKKKGRGGADNISVFVILYGPTNILGDVTIRQERPIDPEDLRETIYSKKQPRVRRKSVVVPPVMVISSIVLLFVAILGGYYFLQKSGYSFSLSRNAQTTSVPITQVTVIQTPTVITLPTLTSYPIPVTEVVINSESLGFAAKVIYCPLKVRKEPLLSSSNDAEELPVLVCENNVNVLGKSLGSDGSYWYQVEYSSDTGATIIGWIKEDTVTLVDNTSSDIIPIFSLVPTSSPSPSVTPTPDGAAVENNRTCQYEVISGDSALGIADNFGVEVNQISCALDILNGCNLSDINDIFPGWVLEIPTDEQTCVQNGGQLK